MNLHYLFHFIKHYVSATRIDVLHSPFVYNLYQCCIARENDKSKYAEIEKLRIQFKADKRTLFYEDFGASAKSRETTVSKLAHQHLKPARIAQILSRMIAHYAYQNCLELGTSLGITTNYLAFGSNRTHPIHTIEASQQVQQIAKEGFAILGYDKKIEPHLGTFDEVLPSLLTKVGKLDFLYIDGNHSYEATLRYFEMCKPYLQNDSVVVFDDIYWSPGMTKAWEEIKQDKSVQISVDLFFVGMVFFRKEQVKEHFQLRIF